MFSGNTALPYLTVAFSFYGAIIIDMLSRYQTIESEISIHNRNVGNVTPPGTCRGCQACDTLRLKDLRRRNLRLLTTCSVTKLIVVVLRVVILVRWQCTACKLTFTDYPDFRPSL